MDKETQLNNISAVIFDLDGTLVDTVQDIAYSMNLVLNERGYPSQPVSDYKSYIGGGTKEMVKAIVSQVSSIIDLENIKNMHDRFTDIYFCNLTKFSLPYAGVASVLEQLSSENIYLGVISNKTDVLTKQIINFYFPEIRFSFVKGMVDGIPKKPNPESTLTSLDLIKVKASEAVFIGDTAIDISTGKAAGMKTIGVTWGYRDRQELLGSGATAIVDHPQDILSLVLRPDLIRGVV